MARGGLQREIQMAKNQLHEVEDDVCGLLSKADHMLSKVESMEQEIGKNKRCLGSCPYPSCWWRYRISKNMEKEKLVISKLLDEVAIFGHAGRVGYPSTCTVPTIEFLSSKDFMVSKASKEASKQIFEALEDDKVSMIGLWGMGGSGKTSLVREVGNHAEKSNLFDKVVFATVSQKPKFHSIQDEIAKCLYDFDMNEINLKERIGIPLGKDHKGCKVLLTTRSLDVCHYMECQKKIFLRCLDDQEALALFKMKADIGNSDDAIKMVAGQIVQKCQGLPIALVTLGSALKGNTNLHRWKATYRRLKDRRLDDIEGINQNAYRCLETFIRVLSQSRKWSEVLAAIDILKNSSLLLDSGEGHVKMHDVVRDFALWIASGRKEISFSIKSEVLEAWREDARYEPYTAIFFKTNRIDELPKGLICPNLKILLLLSDRRGTEVCSLRDRLIAPEAFWSQINLQTLHLENCKLVDISMLGKLTNLRTLHLEWCHLPEISIVGKLKKLQVLSFSASDIKELPEEIDTTLEKKFASLSELNSLQNLTILFLKVLWFEWMIETKKMEITVPELRGRSASTEHLTITNFEDYLFDTAFNLSSLKQLTLRRLPELRVLWKGPIQAVNFQNLIDLEVYGCRRLRYIFSSPTIARNLPQLSSLRFLCCDALEQIIEKDETSKQDHQPIFSSNLTSIEIHRCANLRSLFPVSVAHGLPKLKQIFVYNVSKLEEVFEKEDEPNVSGDKEKVIIHLPQLETLSLSMLPKLKCFSPAAYHFVLPSLRELDVTSCPEITTRFSVDSKQWGHAITEKIPSVDENIMEESATTHQTTWPIGSDIDWEK
ncbi:hypothetical protein PTKIN_Ptkin14bG0156100 [Pterospermum kingtungense]